VAVLLALSLPITPTFGASQSPSIPSAGTYTTAWTLPLLADGALSLTFTAAGLLVSGPEIRTELRAVDDGRVLWTAPDAMEHPPVLDGDLVIGAGAGRLTAVDTATGSVRWQADLNGATRGASSVAGRVLVSNGTELVAFRAADGAVLWRHDAASPALTPPAASAAAAIVALEDGSLLAVRLDDGTRVWRTPLAVTPISLLADGDRLYFGATEGYACAHKVDHGRRDWCFPVRVRPIGTPVADARYVYFAFLDNMVHVFDRRSGRRYSTPSLDALPAGGPRLTPTHLVVPVVTGEFVLLDTGADLSASRVSTPRAQELPLTRAAAVSADGHVLAVVIASPGGRSLVCFSRPAPAGPPAVPPPVTP
jgi:hypothetical protein